MVINEDTSPIQDHIQGGCQCGNIRFTLTSEPIVVYACHCTDCQKQSPSAFGLSVWIRRDDFNIDQGSPGLWQTVAESGNPKTGAYCRDCGSRIYHAFNSEDEILSVKGGALDSARALNPVANIWLRSAHEWIKPKLSDMPGYQTEPDSFDEIVALYRSENNGDK